MTRCALYVALLSVLLLPAGCALGQEKKDGAGPEPAKLERFLRRYFNWPDEVKVTIGPYKPSSIPGMLETAVDISAHGQKQEGHYLLSSDGRYMAQGPVLDLSSDPFAATRAKINLTDAPGLGSPLAPVVIVEYSDMQCPYCQSMDALLRPLPLQYGTQVRVVFKNFPLLQIHAWAMPAALLGRCIYKRYGEAAFWNYDVWVFGNQPQLNPQDFRQKTLDWAKQNKMDSAQLGACMDQPETKAAVDHDLAEAQSLGVSGTPTLFINGRRSVGNLALPQLKQIIDAELSYAQGKR